MPPRKEPKESVVYPASKRKVPAFKPLRPSKVPRIPTTESESSVKSQSATKKAPSRTISAQPARSTVIVDSEDNDDNDIEDLIKETTGNSEEDDSETLEDDPMQATTRPIKPAAPAKRKASVREPTQVSISSEPLGRLPDSPSATGGAGEQMPTQSDDVPSIPQPLLVRLLHEAFVDKNTTIDKHAIQVLQKYVEIFVREAIARAQLEKQQAVERGDVSETDAGWLELEDLEKAAPALFLDF